MTTPKKILASVLFIGITTALLSFDLPKYWHKDGDSPAKYDMGIDKCSAPDGKHAATIKSIDKIINGFGAMVQDCKPAMFAGKRVRMTGLMKTKDVNGWAGLWFKVDPRLASDNMHDGKKNTSVKGTTEWKEYVIVLDVPTNATNLTYGGLLHGTGQMWFTNLNFEIVDKSVPATGLNFKNSGKKYPPVKAFRISEPTNLNFPDESIKTK